MKPVPVLPKLPISIFIIAKNEADRIGDTIRAARGLTDDLVVVDSGSTDETTVIAEMLGARVFHRDWEGYGPQKRFAEEQCRHDWVLNLDADEVVSPDLFDDIRALFARPGGPDQDGYRIGIAEIFPGESEPHRFAYTLWPVRLYRLSRGRYASSPVHDRVDMAEGAAIGKLRGLLHHFSVRSLGDQMEKLSRYSDQQAEDLAAREIVIPTWRVFCEFQASFWKAYIGRRHILRGTYGFLTAMNYGIARHMRMAKHYEQSRNLVRRAKPEPASVDRNGARP